MRTSHISTGVSVACTGGFYEYVKEPAPSHYHHMVWSDRELTRIEPTLYLSNRRLPYEEDDDPRRLCRTEPPPSSSNGTSRRMQEIPRCCQLLETSWFGHDPPYTIPQLRSAIIWQRGRSSTVPCHIGSPFPSTLYKNLPLVQLLQTYMLFRRCRACYSSKQTYLKNYVVVLRSRSL